VHPDHETGNIEVKLRRLYWAIRFGIATIWIWTAIVSWFFYPHAESLAWLRRLGFTYQTELLFTGACLLDLLMGVASCLFPSRRLWQLQFAIIGIYSVTLAFGLPEFWFHPFGPLIKNIAVLGCLAHLALTERH
jgi:DoxX-like family